MDKQFYNIFDDFSESLLDILETNQKVEGDFKRMNQLLFSHLINNFTSFVENLNSEVLTLDPEMMDQYFYQTKKRIRILF